MYSIITMRTCLLHQYRSYSLATNHDRLDILLILLLLYFFVSLSFIFVIIQSYCTVYIHASEHAYYWML